MVRKGKSKYCITGFPNLHDLEIRSGKYGDFLGCTQYFNGCDYTEPLHYENVKTRKNKRRVNKPSKASLNNLKKQTQLQAELRKKRNADCKMDDNKSNKMFSSQFTVISKKIEDVVCPGCGNVVSLNGKCKCS